MSDELIRLSGRERSGSVTPMPEGAPTSPLAGLLEGLQQRVAQAGQMTRGPFHAPGGIDQAAGGAMGTMGAFEDLPMATEGQLRNLINQMMLASEGKMPKLNPGQWRTLVNSGMATRDQSGANALTDTAYRIFLELLKAYHAPKP